MSLRAVGIRLKLVPPAAPPVQILRDYVGAKQHGDLLCWAACVESALRSPPNHQYVTQAELAKLHIYECRSIYYDADIRGTECDEQMDSDRMTTVWYDAGFTGVEFSTDIPEPLGEFVAEELCQRGPIQAWIDQRHGVMIYGYRKYADGKEEVLEMDPQPSVRDYWRSLESASLWTGLWRGLHA